MVDLAHARIGGHENTSRIRLQRKRLQAADRSDTQAGPERKPLCHTAGQAQPGKRPRPGAEGDGVELRDRETGLDEQLTQIAQHGLGMIGGPHDATHEQFTVVQQGDTTVLGGGFDGEDVQGAGILPA